MEKSVGESSADCSRVMVLDRRMHIDQKTGNDAVEKSVGESSADCSSYWMEECTLTKRLEMMLWKRVLERVVQIVPE